MINYLNLSKSAEKSIELWKNNLKKAYYLFSFNKKEGKVREFICSSRKIEINRKKFTEVINKTTLDLSLISARYNITNNSDGLNKYKTSACFIYHFMSLSQK